MSSDIEVMRFSINGNPVKISYRDLHLGKDKPNAIQFRLQTPNEELTIRLLHGVIYQGAEKNGHGHMETDSQERLETLAKRVWETYAPHILPLMSRQTMPEQHYEVLSRIRRALRSRSIEYNPEIQPRSSTTI